MCYTSAETQHLPGFASVCLSASEWEGSVVVVVVVEEEAGREEAGVPALEGGVSSSFAVSSCFVFDTAVGPATF